MQSKTETTQAFKEFCADVGTPREVLTDWGTEFAGRFREYCIDNGVRMRKSCPYVSWQNGLVESRNRRVKEIS